MATKKSSKSRSRAPAAKRKRKTTARKKSAASLRKRAAAAESEVTTVAETPPAAGLQLPAMTIGGMEIPSMDVASIEGTVKTVVDFVEENPLAATAIALGAGVALTAMYWDKLSAAGNSGQN